METSRHPRNGPSVEDASTALAAIEESRARATLADYPAWFWLGTAVGLAGLPASTLLPDWWDLAGSAVAVALLLVTLLWLSRTRRVRDRATAPTSRQLLWGAPVLAVLLVGAVLPRFGIWWAPLVVAVAVLFGCVSVGLSASRRRAG